MIRLQLAAFATALALAACTSTAPRTLSDPAIDYAALRAFAWRSAPRTAAPAHPLDSELLEKRVRALASDALTARGFVADEAAPHFTLRSSLLAKDAAGSGKPRVSIGLGMGSYGRGSGGSVSLGTSTAVGGSQAELNLLIEVHDARSGELVWQGWRKVSDRIGQTGDPELERAVRAILADFPPRR